jgi:signal transduction histidine kinase/CheY-like chemotaxis protein
MPPAPARHARASLRKRGKALASGNGWFIVDAKQQRDRRRNWRERGQAMTSKEVPRGTARTLEEELLRTLARQTRRVPIPVFLAAVMIAALAAQKLPVAAWAGWLLMVAIVLVVRRTLLWRLPRMQGYSDREKLRIAILLNVAMGVVYGLSLLFFPFLPEFERAIQSMILVGLCAGAVATNVGYMPVLSGFLVPTIVPLVLLWALSPGVAEPGWVERSTAVLIALCSAILIPLARDAFRLFRESFEMRLEQAALNQKLQAALERAEEANRAKTRFLAAASHDLRQPIHTLSLFGAALAMCDLDARTREISQNINVALQGMASQFDALLDVSKLDAGVVHVDRAPLEPRRLVERLAHEFAPVAAAKGLEMTASCTFDGVVQTDRLLLERIVRNLTDNAIKYTDAGSIRLGVARAGDDVVVSVADTGRGIPASEHARVFEEFYQLDNPERDRTRGFGLGLSIVKRLADLLDIRLDMESAPGAGTTFRLRLAVAPGGAATAALPAATASRLNGLHVLVVDDEGQVRLGMKTLLEGMGCRATLVDSTQRAVAAAERDRPDIVVADFRLRGEDDGIAAVRALRALYPELPAILLSGDTAPDRLREALAAGIPLLHKPVAVADLASAIASAREPAVSGP